MSTRISPFLIVLFSFLFYPIVSHSQSVGCQGAIPIYNTTNPTWINADLTNAPIGHPGFRGCNDFKNIPSAWYEIMDLEFPMVFRLQIAQIHSDLQIALYRGTCDNLIPVQCQILEQDYLNPSTSNFIVALEEVDRYFLQIGNADGSIAPFDIIPYYESNDISCKSNQSRIYPTNTSLNSPLNGPYQPSEVVNFCAEVEWFSVDNDCQWLHGVVPILGQGWDPAFYSQNGPPVTVPASQLNWYPDFSVQYNYIVNNLYDGGQDVPPGWFATNSMPNPLPPGCGPQDYFFDPNCSWGVSMGCNSALTTMICFDLQVRTDVNCDMNSATGDLTVGFTTFADGETGGWTQSGCENDTPVILNLAAACCDQLPLGIPNYQSEYCEGDLINIDLLQLLGNVPNPDDYTFVYRAEQFPAIVEAYDCFENCGAAIVLDPVMGIQDIITIDYFVSVLNADLCVVGNYEFNLIIYPIGFLEVDIISSSTSNDFCEDDPQLPITLVGNIDDPCNSQYVYDWIGPNGFTSNSIDIVVNTSGTYTFTVSDYLGQVFSDSYTLNIFDTPDIQFNIPVQLCPSTNLQDVLRADPPGGTWSGDEVIDDQFLGSEVGMYIINYMIETADGCIAESSFVIEVVLDPDVSVEFPDYVCSSNQLQDILIPGPPGGTYDPSPILVDGEVLANQAGNYSLTYRYGLPGSICQGTFVFNLTVVENPFVSLTSTMSTVCFSTSPMDILHPQPPGGTYLTNNVNANGEFVAEGLGLNLVEYVYTDPITGCQSYAVTEIFATATDPITITDPGTMCPDDNATIQLSANPAGGLFSGTNITNDGLFTPAISGINTVEYIYENADGCISVESIDIMVLNPNAVDVSYPAVVCENGDPQQITTFPFAGTFDNYVNAANEFFPTQVGTYPITFSYTDSVGCAGAFSFEIEIREFVEPQIFYPLDPLCQSNQNTYQLEADVPGGIFTGPNVTADGIFQPLTQGINQITYSSLSGNTCLIETMIEIEVIAEVDATVTFPEKLCRRPLPYEVLVPNVPGGTWSGPVTSDGRFQAYVLGINEVTYTLDDPQTGCSDSFTFEIEVVQTSVLSQPQLLGNAEANYCIYEIVELCIDPIVGANDYRWDTNFGIIEYATPNHLCIRVAWNALLQDQICVTPIGDCGPGTEPLCLDVEIIDDASCVIIATGLKNVEEQSFNIFPNPTSNYFDVRSNQSISTIQLLNTLGETIIPERGVIGKKVSLNLEGQTPGVYFILINGEYAKRILLTE